MKLVAHAAILALVTFAGPCWAQPTVPPRPQAPVVSDAEVEQEIAEGARRMGVTPEQLMRTWVREGKDLGALRDMIRSYLANKKRNQAPGQPTR